jgi:hypothetical protein
VGRSASEIDAFEATTQDNLGAVSQFSQFALFSAGYEWFNSTQNFIVADPIITVHSGYIGRYAVSFWYQLSSVRNNRFYFVVECFPTDNICGFCGQRVYHRDDHPLSDKVLTNWDCRSQTTTATNSMAIALLCTVSGTNRVRARLCGVYPLTCEGPLSCRLR